MPSIAFERMQKDEFLANGNWTCPKGVSKAYLWASGGGGGGGSSTGTAAGGGGAGAAIMWIPVDVVPDTVYAVTIGAGGAGGTAGNSGLSGGTTTFGSLASFYGGAGGLTRDITTDGYLGDGLENIGSNLGYFGAPGGAAGWQPTTAAGRAGVNSAFASGGAGGDNGLGGNGGGGGGAAWGAGGIGHGDNVAGTAAAANSGAGGGGYRVSGGNNGYAGGSGRLYVYYELA